MPPDISGAAGATQVGDRARGRGAGRRITNGWPRGVRLPRRRRRHQHAGGDRGVGHRGHHRVRRRCRGGRQLRIRLWRRSGRCTADRPSVCGGRLAVERELTAARPAASRGSRGGAPVSRVVCSRRRRQRLVRRVQARRRAGSCGAAARQQGSPAREQESSEAERARGQHGEEGYRRRQHATRLHTRGAASRWAPLRTRPVTHATQPAGPSEQDPSRGVSTLSSHGTLSRARGVGWLWWPAGPSEDPVHPMAPHGPHGTQHDPTGPHGDPWGPTRGVAPPCRPSQPGRARRALTAPPT